MSYLHFGKYFKISTVQVLFILQPRAKGLLLYQKVNGHLKVEESDYFGLQYYDAEGNMVLLLFVVDSVLL